MTYYKATRPDGRSFHAGPDGVHPLWEVGGTVKVEAGPNNARIMCGRGVLHASTEPA